MLLWIEGAGFVSLMALAWLDEFILLPRDWLPAWFGHGGWREAVVESIAIAFVALTTVAFSLRLIRRIHQLESFLKVCAWCRKVDLDGNWVPMEQYLSSVGDIECTHGMCEDCAKRVQLEWSRDLKAPIVLRP